MTDVVLLVCNHCLRAAQGVCVCVLRAGVGGRGGLTGVHAGVRARGPATSKGDLGPHLRDDGGASDGGRAELVTTRVRTDAAGLPRHAHGPGGGARALRGQGCVNVLWQCAVLPQSAQKES